MHNRTARELADLFGREPELIPACLQTDPSGGSPPAGLVLEAARLAVAEHPDYADLHYYASQAAIALGEFDTAASLLADALSVNPAYKSALLLAARVALTRQRPEKARDLLQDALTCGADYPDVHLLIGQLYQQEGDWARARQSYQRALELNPALSAARAALAALPVNLSGGTTHELPA